MAASSPKPNILVSFATDMSEASIASELGKALREAVVSYQDLIAGTATLPSTQTRLSFYGHGDVDVFGSNRMHFTPAQFAAEIIKIKTANPAITDIDLLSCNVGLVDDKGECYASQVQALVAKAGHTININTFLVDNSRKDVHESLFVVGVDSAFGPSIRREILSRGIDLVAVDEFSLDIIRTSNERLMRVSAEIQVVKEQLAFEEALSGMFSSMKTCCANGTYTEAALKGEMRKQYSASTVDRLLDMYHFEYFPGNPDADGYFKCDIPPARQRAEYTGKYSAVREGKYSFSGEIREAQSLTPDDTLRLNVRLSELSCLFAELRAKEGRACKDKLTNIRKYLQPAPALVSTASATPVVRTPSTAGIHGALTAAAMATPSASASDVVEAIKPAPTPMASPSPSPATPASPPPVQQEEAQNKSADDKKKTSEPEPSEFRP